MNKTLKRAALVGAFSLFAVAAPAAAQWSATAIGVAEYDTEETLLLLGGVSAGPGGAGWSPFVGLQSYLLRFKVPTETRSVVSVRPYVGMRNNFGSGSLAFSAGYAFVNKDDAPGPIGSAATDSKDGVVLSSAYDYWGTGGPLGYQLLASYNLGGESFWGRGRVTTRVRQLASGGQFRVGGELAYANSNDFSMTQPGLVAEWHTGGGLILGAGIGRKIIADADDATFFRLETVIPISR